MAKRVTITAIVGDETNQNEVKTWLKSCPYSLEGQQTIAWENIVEEKPAEEEKASDAQTEGAEEKDPA